MKILAFAKLNLTLEVLGKRNDGYHEVCTILQTIDLADQLLVLPHPSLQVECDDPTLSGKTNLVWRAATVLAKRGRIRPKASIFIQKHIPVGMGLGGGSSDAAAALIALNKLWSLSLGSDELAQIAAELGSDVAFFLIGGTALAEGRGERITQLSPLQPQLVTLICPDTTVPNKTSRLYSFVQPIHFSDGTVSLRMAKALQQNRPIEHLIHNVFQDIAHSVFPQLRTLRSQITSSLSKRLHLSGSGPSLFCIPSSEKETQRVTNALHNDQFKAYLVRTVTPELSRI